MDKTAEQERAQVVKYLRETAAIFQGYVDEGENPLLYRHHADGCTYAAISIEAGDHWIALDK